MPAAETLADQLLRGRTPAELEGIERDMVDAGAPIDDQLAVKLARSKSFLRSQSDEVHLSVVFAMYKETTRLLRPDEHPAGEDFVRRKAEQLRWLFDDDDRWDILMIDDGCPDGSGELAELKVAEADLSANARVLYLADAIAEGHATVGDLSSTDESRKGGSILYGMARAVEAPIDGHVVAYTDADLSTNLGQSGLLIEGLRGGSVCAAGSRREPTSVAVKTGVRNDRGKLFIYLWKQMLRELGDIVDTQCGFKAFWAEGLSELVSGAIEKQFAFDLELLLRCAQRSEGGIARVPIAWIDSEQASTTTDLEPYLPMLQAVARMYRVYSPSDDRADQFADLVEALDPVGWEELVGSIPAAILDREPVEFVEWAGVEASELRP